MAEVISASTPFLNHQTLPVLSATVDWLTATVNKPVRIPFAREAVARWATARSGDGYPIRKYSANGYLGEYVDGITWAEREDGAMIRLSGEMAAKHFHSALTWATNVSRIDFQVTLLDNRRQYDWTQSVLGAIKLDPRIEAGMTQFSLITSSKGGATVYIGRRSSSRFFRCYNKTAESEGVWPETSWRFEVEYKPQRSQTWADKVRGRSWQPDDTRDVVARAFADYGFHLPCAQLPRGWTDQSPREPTTDQRRLEYLRKSIRPMLGRLRESYSDDLLLDYLGFSSLDDPEVTDSHT